MKRWLGFIAILLVLFMPMPVMAIGVSPYTVEVDVPADGFVGLTFTVTGCSEVDVSLEDIPLTVEPSHDIPVIDEEITVRIYGDLSKPTQTYQGYLVILESGQQVGAGVKVSLTVNHVNNQSVLLTATVLGSAGGVHFGNGGSSGSNWWNWGSSGTSDYVTVEQSQAPPSEIPIYTPMPGDFEPPYAEGVPMPTQQSSVNWGMVLLVGSAVLVVGLAVWYLRKNRRKKTEIEQP